jgi:hypothetical protein
VDKIDINNSECIVHRDFVQWGYNDLYDLCHDVHHLVGWTGGDYVFGAVFAILVMILFIAFFALGMMVLIILKDG